MFLLLLLLLLTGTDEEEETEVEENSAEAEEAVLDFRIAAVVGADSNSTSSLSRLKLIHSYILFIAIFLFCVVYFDWLRISVFC